MSSAPLRQCRNCGRKRRSWVKTLICCGAPMAGVSPTGRVPSEPEMQNLPGSGGDFVAKLLQRGRI